MTKIIVTGTSGFLGSRIVKFYKEKYEILTPTHSQMNITQADSVHKYFKLYQPDIVIHCAAIADTTACEKEPKISWTVNVTGTENIVKAAKEIGAKCICCSSDQVYCGSTKETANTEDDILTPYNIYGKEKAYAETSCLAIDDRSIHLRLAWMYDANDMQRNSFFKQIHDYIQNKTKLTLSPYDKRGITDVWEVVQNIEAAFALPGGIYNFGSPNNESTYQTAVQLFHKLHYDTELLCKLENANPRNISMSQKKLESYGIQFASTEEGLLRYLKK